MEEEKKSASGREENNSKTIAISFAWELGYSIVIPLVILALGGRLLDNKLGTSPFLFLTALILSIFLSTFIVYKKARQTINSFEKTNNKEKELGSK